LRYQTKLRLPHPSRFSTGGGHAGLDGFVAPHRSLSRDSLRGERTTAAGPPQIGVLHLVHAIFGSGNRDFSGEFFHLRNFENLLYDAVHMLYFSHDIDPESDTHGYGNTFVRGSMVNSFLLLECAANCCIDALGLAGSYFEDVDKLSFLSKYEFFLGRIAEGATFDRGRREIQAVAELKSLRDKYIHPKVSKKQFSKVDDGVYEVEFDKTKLLDISFDPSHWGLSAAVSALKTANDFFNLFFLSWCKFDANTVCDILLGSEVASIPSASSVGVDTIGGLDRAVAEWGIDFRFIGKNK